MSYSNINNVKMVDGNLVEKILEQGQKLRNSMIASILKSDPFNTEIIYNKHFNTPQTSSTDLIHAKKVQNSSLDEKRMEAFIKGDCMTKEEEKLALESIRSLSASDLYKTTQRSLKSIHADSCGCYTCETYNSNYLKCDLRRNKFKSNDIVPNLVKNNEVTLDIQEKHSTENRQLLKYIDSLRISIGSLILNETGHQKVSVCDKNVPLHHIQNFFLEYQLPSNLLNTLKKKSKVDCRPITNSVRLCSRKFNDCINFRHVAIYDLYNLDKVNLNNCEIQFQISYRKASQKSSNTLGYAKLNFNEFLLTKNLTCSRGLVVLLSKNVPIAVGTLKVSVQLGCGKLYFGQEFIDAIYSSQKDNILLDSDDSATQLIYQKTNEKVDCNKTSIREQVKVPLKLLDESCGKRGKPNNNQKQLTKKETLTKQVTHIDNRDQNFTKPQNFTNSSYFSTDNQDINKNISVLHPIKENEKQILFGFLYITEAQYLDEHIINTYLTCRPFCQNETSSSKLVTDTSKPVFSFHQIIPLIFEDDLLFRLRENYMVIEFWQKTGSGERVIGITKISLHQFYLAYRNPIILKYLSKNRLPVIGTDWWEPIYTVDKEYILGQVQVLIALGTEDQIHNLKSDRGFSSNCVKAKFVSPKQTSLKVQSESPVSKLTVKNNKQVSIFKEKLDFCGQTTDTYSSKEQNTEIVRKLDATTQSDIIMDNKPKEDVNMEQKEKENKTNTAQEMLGSLLSQLMSQRQQNVFVENSTNTDTDQLIGIGVNNKKGNLQEAQTKTNVELRKTTDLLESLHNALAFDTVQKPTNYKNKPGCFRANIAINSANHLPSRKKCKSKKSRNKSVKNVENILPSCYVSFETIPEEYIKVSPICLNTTNPIWNYKCDVNLPLDLLENSQKRLIFKVWRKSNNNVSSANMQADTVLGFAAVDLTVLLAGFPNVQGWFNIMDFSGKCNGQINIHITPLENLARYQIQKTDYNCDVKLNNHPKQAVADAQEIQQCSSEPSELLSRAMKRKFSELDEITQRLRLRLSKVTNEDSDTSSDGVADEFEQDINTLCIEEDFDLIDFDEENKKMNLIESIETDVLEKSLLRTDNCLLEKNVGLVENKSGETSSSLNSVSEAPANTLFVNTNKGDDKDITSLDKHLLIGKQQISSLLEKLTLLSAESNNPFQSRYVSGCSINNDNISNTNIDTEAILKELDHTSRPNIQSSVRFNPEEFQEIYESVIDSDSKSNSINTPLTSNSDTSLITNFSDCRLAPDGQGNTSDERITKSNNK